MSDHEVKEDGGKNGQSVREIKVKLEEGRGKRSADP